MVEYRSIAAAAAFCVVAGLAGSGSANADARVWAPDQFHKVKTNSVRIVTAPGMHGHEMSAEVDRQAPDEELQPETVQTYSVTTVRPSRRWYYRKRALGQRFLGFKRQYRGQRYLGFENMHLARRNNVEVLRGKIVKRGNHVSVTRKLSEPRWRRPWVYVPTSQSTYFEIDP